MNTGLTLGTAYGLAVYAFSTLLGLIVYFDVIKPFFKRCVAEFKLGIQDRKLFKKDQDYRNGYGWAMAEVQLGKMEIRGLYEYTSGFNDSDTGEFENGIEKAIDDLVYYQQLEQDKKDSYTQEVADDDLNVFFVDKGDA